MWFITNTLTSDFMILRCTKTYLLSFEAFAIKILFIVKLVKIIFAIDMLIL